MSPTRAKPKATVHFPLAVVRSPADEPPSDEPDEPDEEDEEESSSEAVFVVEAVTPPGHNDPRSL